MEGGGGERREPTRASPPFPGRAVSPKPPLRPPLCSPCWAPPGKPLPLSGPQWSHPATPHGADTGVAEVPPVRQLEIRREQICPRPSAAHRGVRGAMARKAHLRPGPMEGVAGTPSEAVLPPLLPQGQEGLFVRVGPEYVSRLRAPCCLLFPAATRGAQPSVPQSLRGTCDVQGARRPAGWTDGCRTRPSLVEFPGGPAQRVTTGQRKKRADQSEGPRLSWSSGPASLPAGV